MKHPQLPQHPQHPHPAANENSSRANLLDQADPSRLYKQATSSRGKESTDRSRRDYFSGSSLSFSSKRPHRGYFSGSPYRATNKKQFMTDPQKEAISLSQSGCRRETDPVLTPPRAALPDVAIEVGLEPPEAASTSRIPCEDRPPVVLEIPSSTPEPEELSEPHQCPDTPGKWFQPPSRGSKRQRSSTPPFHAVLESASLPLEGGVSNGSTSLVHKCQNPYTLLLLLVVPNKGYLNYPPNPCNPYSVTQNKGISRSHSPK